MIRSLVCRPFVVPSRAPLLLAIPALVAVGCSAPDRPDASADNAASSMSDAASRVPAAPTDATPLIERLVAGQPVFGAFPGESTRAQGALMGANRELDFVFYSLESGPFDLETAGEYMAGIAEGAGDATPHPLILRIPSIRDGAEAAQDHVARALDAEMAAIVFPHVESPEDAAVAVAAMGDALWPANPEGSLLAILIIEDRAGVERADEIVGTAGVSVVFAGPGDLRRAYGGDMEAVENAIQRVLAACLAHGVPCGITAGADDIAGRIAQGFRIFIVNDVAAVRVGRMHEQSRGSG